MKEGWTYKKLGEVGITQTGTTPSKSNPNNYGNYIPFIRPAEISIDGSGHINYDSEIKLSEEGLKNGRLFKKGATLMVCIGSIGKLGYAERNISCNQQINVITPFDEYYPKYIFYAMSSPAFQKECLKIAQGAQATLPIINKGKWSNLLISIPSSREEQQRIVSRLDSAFAHIDELKANAEKQLSEARTLFQKALTKAMEPKEGWEEKTLKDIAQVRIGPFGSLLHKKDYISGGIPLVNPIHMIDGKIVVNNDYTISDGKAKELSNYLLKVNDIIFARRGEVGRCALVSQNEEGYLCGTGSLFVRFIDIVEFPFMLMLFQSESCRAYLEGNASGATMLNINASIVENMPLTIPPLSEQQRIVSRLDSLSAHVRELEEVLQKTIAECDALKQALLRKVFE